MSGAGYPAPAAEGRAELREKGSRFLAVVRPVADAEAARALLDELERRYRGATHLCWAWRLGWPPHERSSDAGEPRGTAGVPMLQVLRGAGLSDSLAVVARWFGGTKLGKGGLARAYADAVRAALADVPRVERRQVVRLELEVPIGRRGELGRLLRPPAVEIVEEAYGATARLTLRVEQEAETALREALAALGVTVSTSRVVPPG